MTTPINVYSRPDSALAGALASLARSRGVAWSVARSLAAEACGLSAADLEAVERGQLPDANMITRLAGVGGLLKAEDGIPAIGWRASGRIERVMEGGKAAGFRFTMSTSGVDRANDIVDQDWDLAGFNANPVAYYNHNTWGLPIGSWRGVGGSPLAGEFVPYRPADMSLHSLAVVVADMLEQGHLNACSVGFLPGAVLSRSQLTRDDPRWAQSGYVYMRPQLLECSIVGIPMNGAACRIPEDQPPGPAAKSITTTPTEDWWG